MRESMETPEEKARRQRAERFDVFLALAALLISAALLSTVWW